MVTGDKTPSSALPTSFDVSGNEVTRSPACVLGIPIDTVSIEDVAAKIGESAKTRRRLFISTVNMNFLALAHRSPDFRASLRASDLCTADGVVVVAICRFLGVRVRERVAGSDFVHALATRSGSVNRVRIQFFGGTEQAGELACDAVNAMAVPHVTCAGSVYPGFASLDAASTPEILGALNRKPSDFLIVALGAEKGQAWIMRNLARIDAPIVSHLGATINFLAGNIQRAPKRVQRLGFEWLWRIYQEPHLFKRYLSDALSLIHLLFMRVLPIRLWLLANSWRNAKRLITSTTGTESEGAKLMLTGAITRHTTGQLETATRRALARGQALTLDLAGVSNVDLYGIGTLFVIAKSCAERGQAMRLENTPRRLRFCLKLCGAGDLLTV